MHKSHISFHWVLSWFCRTNSWSISYDTIFEHAPLPQANFDPKYITNQYAHRNAALNPDTLLPPKLWIWSITMRSGSVTMLRAFGQMTTIENFDQSWQITPSSSYKGADFKNTCSSSLKLLPFAAAAA